MSTLLLENDQLHVSKGKPSLTVDVISEEAEFVALEEEWDSLAEASDLKYPFLTFTWMKTWWECFGDGRHLHIVRVRNGLGTVAIAPLMLSEKRMYGWKLRTLEFMSNVHTPRLEILVSPTLAAGAYEAIWSYLCSQNDKWDLLLLCQLPEESQTLREVSRYACQAQLPMGTWRSAESPFVPINGRWIDYLGTLKQKHRANLRRRVKRLEEQGKVALMFAEGARLTDELIEEALKLEGAAWKGANGTSIESDTSVKKFYALLAHRFAEKEWLKLHFLTLDGRFIAMQYAVLYRNRAFSLKPGYHPAYASYSPSNVLFMLFLERAFDEGLEEYDLLGVNEEWKMSWTKATRSHYWLFVFSNTVSSRLLHFLKFTCLPFLKNQRQHFTRTGTGPSMESSGVSSCTSQLGRA